MPTLQLVPQITEKLEFFRTDTLAKLEPVSKKKQAANAVMDELLDTTVGLDNFVVPDMPISITRAGLYIHLNASVGPPPSSWIDQPADSHTARGATTNRRCGAFLLFKYPLRGRFA